MELLFYLVNFFYKGYMYKFVLKQLKLYWLQVWCNIVIFYFSIPIIHHHSHFFLIFGEFQVKPMWYAINLIQSINYKKTSATGLKIVSFLVVE